jgi:type II secretory ATPase GspE/PulE/Tfp pilus assembly ATPase PilB-like protein
LQHGTEEQRMAVSGIFADISGGGYISIYKIVPVVLVLLMWTKLLTWVDKDAPALQLPGEKLNMALFGGVIVAFAAFFILPNFFIAFGVLVLCVGAEAGIYLHIRSKKSDFEDVKKQFSEWLKSLAGKKPEARPEVEEGKIAILDKKGAPIMPPEQKTPERAIYDAMQTALAEPLAKSAEQIDLAPEAEGLATKYVVDGVIYRGAVLNSAVGATLISQLKEAAGLSVAEVRKPQTGTFKVTLNGKKRDIKAQTAGTRAGEYLRMMIDFKKKSDISLASMGLSERQSGFIKEIIADKAGIVIISAPKGQGLTSALYAIVKAHDVFIEHIQTIERDSDDGIDGATLNRLPANTPSDEEAKKVEWVISQEPDVIAIAPIESPQSAQELIEYAKSGRRVYVGMRAASTFEAVETWRKLVGDDTLAMSQLRLVTNSRILRKLCGACKVGYAPDAPTLRKLGINPERVTALYQARTSPLRDPKGNIIPCEFCNELRFKGRVGVYETLMVDDDMRNTVVSGKPPSQAFRKQRGKYLQEEALALVEKGETSVQEVLRVLKGAPAAPSAGSSSGARKAEPQS